MLAATDFGVNLKDYREEKDNSDNSEGIVWYLRARNQILMTLHTAMPGWFYRNITAQ